MYAGLCRRDRLTSKECPFWLDSLFCGRGFSFLRMMRYISLHFTWRIWEYERSRWAKERRRKRKKAREQCFHKSSMKFPFSSIKFPFSPLIFPAKITKIPFKFPSYSGTSQGLWHRLRINNLYSGASSLVRLCLKRKYVEHMVS